MPRARPLHRDRRLWNLICMQAPQHRVLPFTTPFPSWHGAARGLAWGSGRKGPCCPSLSGSRARACRSWRHACCRETTALLRDAQQGRSHPTGCSGLHLMSGLTAAGLCRLAVPGDPAPAPGNRGAAGPHPRPARLGLAARHPQAAGRTRGGPPVHVHRAGRPCKMTTRAGSRPSVTNGACEQPRGVLRARA